MTGAEVREIRRRLGLSQAAFAELVGVHWVTVSRWETGAMGIREATARLMRLLADQKPKRRMRKRR